MRVFTVFRLAKVRLAAVLCLSLIMLMMACSIVPQVYLSQLVAATASSEEILWGVGLYLLLGFMVHPLGYLAYMLIVPWKSGARRAFYEAVYSRTFGRVAQVANRNAEKSFSALIAANGQEIVSDCVDFVRVAVGSLFSSLLSVTLISAFVIGEFAIAYAVSVILCALLIWRFGKWTANTANVLEKAYNRFLAALPEGWLANSLGEQFPMARFMRLFERRWRTYRRAALSAQNAFQGFSLLQALCIWGPTVAVIIWQSPDMSMPQLIALVVVMPQLVHTLIEISELLENVTYYLALRGRAAWLNSALEEETLDLHERCDLPLMRLRRKSGSDWRYEPISTFDDLVSVISVPGRYAIDGPNGCGKTSLLLLLKSLKGGHALFVPAQAFLFPAAGAGASVGQRKLRDLRLAFGAARGQAPLILLDEWDANLDQANLDMISAEIDELAREHSVVEVSHRSKDAAALGQTQQR